MDTLLLTLLLYWPARAFVAHWDVLSEAVERWTEEEEGRTRCHFLLQQLLARSLLRVNHHPSFQFHLRPSLTATQSSAPLAPSESPVNGRKVRLSHCLERLLVVVLSFVVTGGSRSEKDGLTSALPLPSSRAVASSSSLSHHSHHHLLQRSDTTAPDGGLTKVLLPLPRVPLTPRSVLPSVSRRKSESAMHSRQRSTSGNLALLLQVDLVEKRRMGVRGTGEDGDVLALLDELVQERRSDLRLRWQWTSTGEGGRSASAWQLADAPLLALLARVFSSHPLHGLCDVWLKLSPDLEKLRRIRGTPSDDWWATERRHLCAFLLVRTAEERRQADNALQTEIRGLAGTKVSGLFGDMPRLNTTDSPQHRRRAEGQQQLLHHKEGVEASELPT